MDEIKLHQFAEKLQLAGYSRRCIQDYPEIIKSFFRFLEEEEGVKSLDNLQPEHVKAYQVRLAFEPGPGGKKLSPATIISRLGALRTFFRIMHQENLLPMNYAVHILMPRQPKRLPKNVPEYKDIRKLMEKPSLKSATGLRDRCVMELLYAAGIRNSELRSLTLKSLSLTEKTLHVLGKGNKERMVPLGEWMIPWLREYIHIARPKLMKKTAIDEGILFPTRNGKPLSKSRLICNIRRWVKRAGLTVKITPHSFRHACATHLVRAGADIRHVQELLGHASLSTTQIYTQVTIKDLKEAHRKFHPRNTPCESTPS
jgi:integrase/recombinase XerD